MLKTTLPSPTTLAFLYCFFNSFEFFHSAALASWYQALNETSASEYAGFSKNSLSVLKAMILMKQQYKDNSKNPNLGYFNFGKKVIEITADKSRSDD